jgi:hypothetical protein
MRQHEAEPLDGHSQAEPGNEEIRGIIMSGHHKFNKLIENISPERKARIEQKAIRIKQEMALNELQQDM